MKTMFCPILCKRVISTAATTFKSFGSTHQKKVIFLNQINEYNSVAFRPLQNKFRPNFAPLQLCRAYSEETLSAELPKDPTLDPSEALFSKIDQEALTNNDPELVKNLNVLMAEIYVMYEEGEELPSSIKTEQMGDLLKLKSRIARKKFLRFLLIKERYKETKLQKKLARRKEREEIWKEKVLMEVPKDKILYGLQYNSLFLRFYDPTMDMYNNFTLLQASMFAPKLVVDCGFDADMSDRESMVAAKQIAFAWAENRLLCSPIHLMFCNYDKESKMAKELIKHNPTFYESHYPFDFHSESYLEFFPRQKMVYLTPHCRDELTTVNKNDIYIIGGFVDQESHAKRSLAIAKEQGIRMAKFPIDQHLAWKYGSKNLTISHSILIMAEMYWKNDWKYAFSRWIPKRRLAEPDEVINRPKIIRSPSMSGHLYPPLNEYPNKFSKKFSNNNRQRDNFYNFRDKREHRESPGAFPPKPLPPRYR